MAEIQISWLWVVFMVVAILLEFAAPLALSVELARRFDLSWRFFGIGIFIFLVSQGMMRIPLENEARSQLFPEDMSSLGVQLSWIFFSALLTAFFCQFGHFAALRWLFKEPERDAKNTMMYALGFGGIQLFAIACLTLFGLLAAFILPFVINRASYDAQLTAREHLANLASQATWYPLVSAWDRLLKLIVHIALALLVLQVFKGGGMRWLWYAMAAHWAVIFVSLGLPAVFRLEGGASLLASAGIMTLIAAGGCWLIWRYRDPDLFVFQREPQIAPRVKTS
jgi:Predicted membrane protein